MGKKRNRSNTAPVASDPTDQAPVEDVQEAPTPTPEPATDDVVAPVEDATDNSDSDTEDTDQAPVEDVAADTPTDPLVFWVDGFGSVTAKSQAEAEKKAKKILAERLK